jgi:hypothetical protein
MDFAPVPGASRLPAIRFAFGMQWRTRRSPLMANMDFHSIDFATGGSE